MLWGRQRLPREIEAYNRDFLGEDRRNAIALAGEIKEAQAGVVSLQTQHLQAVRELRRLMNAGLAMGPQQVVVDGLATRLRDAQAHVEEMRAYARFFYRDYFTR